MVYDYMLKQHRHGWQLLSVLVGTATSAAAGSIPAQRTFKDRISTVIDSHDDAHRRMIFATRIISALSHA